MRIIGYERVSTARQGASGLGLEAQRQAIEAYAVQRGADPHRPLHRGGEAERGPAGAEEGAASGQGHRGDAGDRQARPAVAERRFPADARDSGVRFSAVDLPEANDLTVGIMALVAQQEREAISRRTKEALSIAKSRGVKLGNLNGAAALRRAGRGGAPLRAAIARNADRHAQDLAPVVEDIRARGAVKSEGDRGGAQRARHADATEWALARVDRDEPARPAGPRGRRHAPVPADVVRRGGANVAVGFGVAVLTQMLVFPLFGLRATVRENLAIGVIFTVVSLARSYALRRTFVAMRGR